MYDQAQNLRDMVQKLKHKSAGTRIVSVTSGKGGVGKSSFAVNLALALSKRGLRVLIIDADFGLANIDVMLGVNSLYDLSHVLNDKKDIKDIIVEGHSGVRFISGGSGVYDLLTLDETQLRGIINSLLKLDDLADIIIFDTGAGVSDNILRLVQSSTEVVLITTPEPTAILDAYALVKTMRKTEDTPPISLVVNMVQNAREGKEAMNSFIRIAYKYMSLVVEELGCIPFDPMVSRSVKMQTPLMLSAPKCPAALSIEAIADNYMIASGSRHKGGMTKFFDRLLNRG